jgi:hypothetical protein
LRGIGLAAFFIPLTTVAVAITLLPVLLATIGPKADHPRLRRRSTPAAPGHGGHAWCCATGPPRWPRTAGGDGTGHPAVQPAPG